MGRYRKAQLVIAVVFALSGTLVSSAAASGQGVLTSDGPVRLAGVDIVKSTLTYNDTQKTECNGNYGLGEVNQTEPEGRPGDHYALVPPATTLTIEATYSSCVTKIGPTEAPATATMNGCDYVLHIGETLESGKWATTMDVVCPAGAEIEEHAYSSGTHSSMICTFKVPAQTGKTGGFVKNIAGGKITLGGTIEGISASRTGILCGGTNSVTTAKLDIDVQISSAVTAISITD